VFCSTEPRAPETVRYEHIARFQSFLSRLDLRGYRRRASDDGRYPVPAATSAAGSTTILCEGIGKLTDGAQGKCVSGRRTPGQDRMGEQARMTLGSGKSPNANSPQLGPSPVATACFDNGQKHRNDHSPGRRCDR